MDFASSSSRFSNEEDDEAEASPREIPFMTAAAATTADTGAAASSSSSPFAAAAASGSAAALSSSDGAGASGTGGDDDVEVIEKERMFDKVMTPSDVGKLNRLVIPKQHAEKYFPLDAAANEKGLLLSFEDRAGKLWRFRYSYWNSSQSYVMTKGWSRFVKEKRLHAGDTVSFCRGAGEAVRDRLFIIDWKRPDSRDPHRMPRPPLPMAPVASPYGALGPWGGGEGRDGSAGGSSWSYRRRHEEIGSSSSSYTISSSSRSVTIVSSNAYTSGASRSCSRFSSNISMEAAALMELELELRLGTPDPDKTDAEFGQAIKKRRKEMEETALKETRMKRIESLVQEFFRGPSENRSILGGGGGGMSALESSFSELGVGWVLQLDVGASGWTYTSKANTGIWVRALTQIMETIHLTESFFPGMPGIGEEEEVDSGKQTSLDPLQFALFIQKAMAKMLIFVDYVFSKSISIQERIEREDTFLVPLNSCLIVNRALSEVLSGSRLQFHSSPPIEVESIEKEMVSLLSAKQVMAFDAIWSSLEKRRTCVLKSMEDSLGAETPQGSSDIHQATYSVMNHIKFLLYNCWEVDPLFVSKAARLGKYVPQTGLEEAEPFVRMIAEMVFCLGEKLITRSQSFRDKSLRLVFLLNNSNFIREQLQDSMYCIKVDLVAIISSITRNVEHYTESYIQVPWEPMLACLSNPTPLRLVRKYSPLSKFESEFQKIYTTQEFWKVPDPGLRKRLRKAVIEKVIPAYTKHIEDSKVTNLKFTPQELEETLQELFEG